jgi:hypothetical protein
LGTELDAYGHVIATTDTLDQEILEMADLIHPAAIHHLPPFITAPGQTDVLMVVMAVFLLAAVIGIGVVYLMLHSLPEQLAHRGQKMQFQIVAVLGLLALVTHNHAFWVAGLLLALVPLPDFGTPLSSIARSLERIAASSGPEHATRPAQAASSPTGMADPATANAATPIPTAERPAAQPET